MKKGYIVFGILSAIVVWGIMTGLDAIDEYVLQVESRYGTLFVVAGPILLAGIYFLVSIRDVRPKVINMLAWLIPFTLVSIIGGAVISFLAVNGKYLVTSDCREHIFACFNGWEYVNLLVTVTVFCVLAYLYHLICWQVKRSRT